MSDDRTFQPIANPYIVGNPVEDERMFFGREVDFEYIRTKFGKSDHGGMVVLCGTRRSGKTSILFQVKKGRLGPDYLPVLVDMQAVSTENDAEFIHLLAEKILEAAGERAGGIRYEPVGETFADLRAGFLAFRRDLSRHLGVSIVVMFDEYEIFERNIDDGRLSVRVLDLLGEAIGGAEGLFLLFAGSTKLEDRQAAYWESSLGKAFFKRISFLMDADARSLIRDPVRDEIEYEAGVPDRLIALGARQPFYTQALCRNLIDHLNDTRSRKASLEDVEEIALEVVDNPLPHMTFTWGAFSDPEKVVVASLGELNREGPQPRTAQDILDFLKEEKTGITLSEGVARESLERLFLNDILNKDEDSEHFDFRMDLWRLWVCRMHTIWQAKDEIFNKEREDKPDPAVIRVARRRWKRIGLSTLALVLAGSPFFGIWAREKLNPPDLPPPTPMSYFQAVTTPPGAMVYLGNEEIGTMELGAAPIDSAHVPAGRYAYRCELEGYRTYADSITLAADTLIGVEVTLEELLGGFRVETTPPGATVRLDGELLSDTTPVTLTDLSVRDLYTIRVSLDRHVPHTFENRRVYTDSVVVLAHNFNVRRHGLTIATSPPGATIRLDGADVGRSPRTLPGVEEGPHRLSVSLPGYFGQEQRFTAPVAGDRIDIELVKHPPGRLLLRSTPFCDMYVNGELVATREIALDLVREEGEYEVEFRKEGFEPFVRRVTLEMEQTVTISHQFRNP